MKQKRIPANGSVFLVPLPTGDFGIGVLIRADGKGRAYGTFFGPRVADASKLDIAHLRPQDAIFRSRFGDYGLHTQRWTVIGSISNWDPSHWPIPKFFRRHDNQGMVYVTEYDDNLDVISEVVLPADEAKDMPEDIQLGSSVVEVKLAKLLA